MLPASRADPAPARRSRGAAGLCLQHRETPDGSPLEVTLPSSRARPGVPGGRRGAPAPQRTQLPRFSPGAGGAAGRLGRGTSGSGRPPARVAFRGGGRAPRPQLLSWDGAVV